MRGDSFEVWPAYEDLAVRITLWGDEIEEIVKVDPLTQQVVGRLPSVAIYPATHFVTTGDAIERAVVEIGRELEERVGELDAQGKQLEAFRLRQRTQYDMEMLKELGYCSGIENYSRILDGRAPGTSPHTLLDYFPDDFLVLIDESHNTIPQLHGMYHGDRSRKLSLIDNGFRLPSALDNRPLRFEEFLEKVPQVVFVSATPGEWELSASSQVVEQLVRPTGLVDPEVEVRATRNQIDDLMNEIRRRVERHERVLVTTLTKKMAEDLTDYLLEMGFRVRYLHSEVDTLERIQIVRDLRLGEFDVLVGINLLREGLDLPEVTLVAILDADKEGFLRGATSLIQTIGRASRNVDGRVIMYGDRMTQAMEKAIGETNRRRAVQVTFNEVHGITPRTIVKGVSDITALLGLGEVVPRKDKRSPGTGRGGHVGGRDGEAARLPRGGDAPRGRGAALRVRRYLARRDSRSRAGAEAGGALTKPCPMAFAGLMLLYLLGYTDLARSVAMGSLGDILGIVALVAIVGWMVLRGGAGGGGG